METKRDNHAPGTYLLPSRAETYTDSLIRVTRLGGFTAGIFISSFVLIYWLSGYPRLIVLVNLAALLIDLAGLALVSRFRVHPLIYRPAAHLIIFATYSALLGTALLTGGIDASSLVWMA